MDVLFGFYMRYDYKILAGMAAAALSYYFHDLPLLWVAASAVIFGVLDYFALIEPVLCSKACIYITSALSFVFVIGMWGKLIALILAVVAGIWGIALLFPFILPPVLQGLAALHGRIKSSSWFTTRTVVGTIFLMKIVRVYGMSDVIEAASAAADAASAVGAAISSGGDTVGATLASLASGTAPSVAQGAAALGAAALLSGSGDSEEDEEDDEPVVVYDVDEENYEDPEAPEESTPCHPRDPVQEVLNNCRVQAYHMWKRFELFLPTFFFMAGAFFNHLLPQLGDSRAAKVYYHRAKKKIGCAGNGIVRSSFYEPLAFILTVFNLDLQSLKNTELLSTFAINLCQFFCSISPSNLLDMTIQDAIDMEEMRYQEDNQKIHLPFVVCIFMYMIGHSEEECEVLGGVIRVRSYLKRLCLLIVESGVQELLVSIGVELSKACQAHEWLQGSMSWVPASHNECAGEGESFFKKVKELDTSADPLNEDFGMSYFAYILATSIQMIALASWAADTVEGHLVLTDVIMDLIFGFFNWGDAFGDEHPVKRGPGVDIYDASKFSSAARSRARDRISLWLEYLKGKVGGFGALNRCKAAFDGPDLPTVEQFLEQHDFYHFFTFTLLHIEVYMYQEMKGLWPVFIFLHGPPCYMADSTFEMKVTPSIVESMKKRCKEMYAIFLICLKLREPDASSNIDRDLANYSIFGNLLVAHVVQYPHCSCVCMYCVQELLTWG